MRHIFITILLLTTLLASVDDINSFEADFIQTITDDKNKVLTYKGNIIAKRPQSALWRYQEPIKKYVYINKYNVTIVEPDLEQVMIKKIESSFNIFYMLQNAKKISNNTYETYFKNSKFIINKNKNFIESISYIDEFENKVKIIFTNQKLNKEINAKEFIPEFSVDFDIIRE